ncbi:MAG: right-handed parallel beta-helix repeat-containing protein [Candidatus Hydrogenedentes bacterium]|nr:right-handed parallel beta-helix repeat-containing protein [Candidatus Hydrogenedentota bacterium]
MRSSRRELFSKMFSCANFFFASNILVSQQSNEEEKESRFSNEYISGDNRYEQKRFENFVITVGQDSTSDIQGRTEKAIQGGIDYLAKFGGGVVKVRNGVYEFSNSLFLRSGVKILGDGDEVLFLKRPAKETKLTKESDWYEAYISVEDPEFFQVGEGICIQTKNPHTGGRVVIKRTIVGIEESKLILDKPLRENVWSKRDTVISSLYPLVSGEYIQDVVIENVRLDGNKEHNPFLDGNYAGCIWLQDCKSIVLSKVEAKNYNGDGISWQIVHDLTVSQCCSHHNAGLGLHPGSGSQRARILNSKVENNDIGIFFCWGAKFGLVEGCHISNNKIGISIGHSDSYNIIRNNKIVNSYQRALLFRAEDERFIATGNIVKNNLIENLLESTGRAISLEGAHIDNKIVDNDILDNLGPYNKVGIWVGKNAKRNIIEGNRVVGFYKEISEE